MSNRPSEMKEVVENGSRREPSVPDALPSNFLGNLLTRFLARSENYVSGRYWLLETLFLAVMFTVLFSGGVDERLSVASGNRWFPAYFEKIEHPFMDVAKGRPPQGHEAKLNFRLTVPVVLHILHVPTNQFWTLPVLAACGSCVLILLSCIFAYRVTGDRVCGFYTALAVSCTYIGSFGFTMYYDTIALGQLALAMLPGTPWFAKGLLVFTASFTDERAFPASLFLVAQSLCMPPLGQSLLERLRRADFLAVIAGMVAYCAARLALETFAGLTSPHQGIGISLVLGNAKFWHAGIWLALKGGWLMLAVAAASLWQRRQFGALAFCVFVTSMCVAGGFLVDDVVRSTSYVFPAFLLALMIVGASEKTHVMRLYCLAVFTISAVTGNYTVWRSEITWMQPVAAKFLHGILQAIFKTPYSG